MWRNLLFLIISFGLAGCRTKHKTVTPEIQLPETFTQSGTEALPEKWWHILDDPNLDDVIDEALENNFTILSAWDRLYQAEQVAVKAGAYLWPDIQYSGSAGRSRQENNGTFSSESSFMAGLIASYEIDLWGKIDARNKALMLDIDARQEDLAAAAITLSATISKKWYQLAEAKEQADIITSQINTNESILEIINLKFRKSTAGAPDVLRQRQLVENTRGQLVQVNKTVTLLQYQLSVLLGKPPETQWENRNFHLIEIGNLPNITVPSELMRHRPDVVSAYKAVQKADQEVAVAVAQQYPSISLVGTSGTTSSEIEDLFEDWVASLAGSLIGPLFDAGFRQAEVNRNRGALSEAVHTYMQTVINALRQVEDAISEEAFQRKYVHNIQKQRILAQKSYESVRRKYINGQLDYLRVLDALISLQDLERDEVTARRRLIEYRIDLCRAIAGPWDMERPALAQLDEQ
jgi:NodT family efflux transporter outer membrane factor (OMF) lipoprotein